MKTYLYIQISAAALAAALLVSQPLAGQQTPSTPSTLQTVLAAHRGWPTLPSTIEITGSSTRGAVTEPIHIIATSREEIVIERGQLRDRKSVTTPTRVFRDDGSKVTPAAVQSGFSQLDPTGIYMLACAVRGESKVSSPVTAPFDGGQALKVSLDRGRTEKHLGRYEVRDVVDLYLDAQGRLAGIARSFYPPSAMEHYTMAWRFSEYREAGGVVLPHRLAAYAKGKLIETIEVSEYRFDVFVDTGVFVPRRGK